MGDNLKATNAKAAREWYEKIIRTYPDIGAAKEARSRLKSLKSR
jgi:TolA-binding protein